MSEWWLYLSVWVCVCVCMHRLIHTILTYTPIFDIDFISDIDTHIIMHILNWCVRSQIGITGCVYLFTCLPYGFSNFYNVIAPFIATPFIILHSVSIKICCPKMLFISSWRANKSIHSTEGDYCVSGIKTAGAISKSWTCVNITISFQWLK